MEHVGLFSIPGGIIYYSPPLGVHRLYGYLCERRRNVDLVDLRVEFWRYWSSEKKINETVTYLEKNPHKISSRFICGDFIKRFINANVWGHGNLYPEEYIEPQTNIARFLMENSIEKIIKRMLNWTNQDTSSLTSRIKMKNFWQFQEKTDVDTFIWVCILLSCRFFPTILKPEGIFTKQSPFSSKGILDFVNEHTINPFLSFAHDFIIPLIKTERYSTVGISVTHEGELIPAITFSQEIKKYYPEIRIVWGGMQAALMAPNFARVPRLIRSVDYLVSSPVGEICFENILDSKDIAMAEHIPAIYFHKNGRFISSNVKCTINMDKVGRPKYPKQYQRYYNSYAIITSLECYWAKCTFCTYTHNAQMRKMTKLQKPLRSLGMVLDDIREVASISMETKPVYIYIEDSSMPIERLTELLENVHNAGMNIDLYAFMRLESKLLKIDFDRLRKLGLKRVFVGLEAGCQRVNDFMNKGVNVNTAGEIIPRLYRCGIEVNVGTIIGFPTEKYNEAQETLDFIISVEPYINRVEINPFRLEKTSVIYREATKYGIKIWSDESEDLSIFSKYSFPKSIGSNESVAICNQFNKIFVQKHNTEIDWNIFFNYLDK